MVYLATQQVVKRVRPLLEQIATRTIDKARLLQYLSAMAGVRWELFELVGREGSEAEEVVRVRDRTSGTEFSLAYPQCLPREWEPLVVGEYLRLAVDKPLTHMDAALFAHLFGGSHCAGCRWRGERQVCHECHFAGNPVNYEPSRPEAAPFPIPEAFLN